MFAGFRSPDTSAMPLLIGRNRFMIRPGPGQGRSATEGAQNGPNSDRLGTDMNVDDILVSLAETVSGITPLIPYYHTVSDERLAHIRHLHPYKNERQFSADVDYLGRRYSRSRWNDLLDFVRREKELKKGSFILTFDDGYSQAFSVIAPLLSEGHSGHLIFLTADFIDNRGLSHRNKASIIVDRLLRDGGDRIAPSSAVLARLDATPGELPKRILALRNREADVLDEIALLLGVDFKEYLSQEQPFLTSPEIGKLLGMGFSIGTHSFEHPLYQDLPIDEQVRETTGSVNHQGKVRIGLFAVRFPP